MNSEDAAWLLRSTAEWLTSEAAPIFIQENRPAIAQLCHVVSSRCNRAADAIAALRKENEELRKDKARLDWLNDHYADIRHINDVSMDGSRPCFTTHNWREGKCYRKTVREAIDAAMEEVPHENPR